MLIQIPIIMAGRNYMIFIRTMLQLAKVDYFQMATSIHMAYMATIPMQVISQSLVAQVFGAVARRQDAFHR